MRTMSDYKWVTQKIRISRQEIRHAFRGQPRKTTVIADVCQGLAVHENDPMGGFNVTHVTSGRRLAGPFVAAYQARACAEELLPLARWKQSATQLRKIYRDTFPKQLEDIIAKHQPIVRKQPYEQQ